MNFQLSPSDLLAPGKAQRSDVLLVLLRDGYEVLTAGLARSADETEAFMAG